MLLLYVGEGDFLVWATVLKRLSTLKENLEPFLASEVAAVEGLEIIFGGIGGEDFDEFSEGDDGTGAKFKFLSGRPLEAATEVFTVIIENNFHFDFGHFSPLKSCIGFNF